MVAPIAAVALIFTAGTGAVAWQQRAATSERPAATRTEATATIEERESEEPVSRSDVRAALDNQDKNPSLQATPAGSRDGQQLEAPEVVPDVKDRMFVTTELNVRSGPGDEHDLVTVLPTGSRVGVTGVTDGDWAEIVHEGSARWVSASYLSESKPEPEEPSTQPVTEPVTEGLSDAPCDSGSDVESGLTSNAIAVHRAVCAEFPEVDSYGGLREGDDGEHGEGRALDIMVSDSALGDAIAEFVRENYDDLGVSEVIWSQRIWTVERSDEGWRWMEDRGSDTANHYDHVHVTVY